MAVITDFTAFKILVTQYIKDNASTDNSKTKGINHRYIELAIVDTLESLLALIGSVSGGGGFVVVEQQVATTDEAIVGATSGIKQAIFSPTADTTYTGLAIATGSGKVFAFLNTADFPVRFNRAIAGVPAGDILLPTVDSSIMFSDAAPGVYKKLI